jgi:oxygen-dependent protoporphyrinogen oxidase
MRAVVVGGGIAGLAAARRLEAVLPTAEVVLVEQDERLGGKVATERVDGFVIEAAPDSFLSRKPRGVGLCEELGLGGELVGRRPESERTFVRRGAELHPLPSGLTGMIPTNLDALAESELLSPEGRARLAAEVDVPVGGEGDESIASFVSRRLGREAYEAFVEPLMTGIYGGDGEQLSLEATFPQLRALELEHGSLIEGLSAQPAQSAALPPFVTLRAGMDELVGALTRRLRRTRLVTGRPVGAVSRAGDGYRVELDGGDALETQAVVVAAPAFATAEMLSGLDDELAAAHAEIPYSSSVIVTFGLREEDVSHPLDGYGYVVPRVEGTDVLACTWTSRKWEGRAPDGALLIRVYAGRFGGPDLTTETDEDLVRLARDELSLLGIDAVPILTRVQRWPRGMPQYVLGHGERLARIEAALTDLSGLAVAGAAYRGVGIPDCIRSGEDAAESAAHALTAASLR